MKKKAVLWLSVAVALTLSIAAVYKSSSIPVPDPQAVLADGQLDYNYSLLNASSAQLASKSVRPLYLIYEGTQNGEKVVGSQILPAVVVSDEYVVTARNAATPVEGFKIIAAFLLPIDSDLSDKTEKLSLSSSTAGARFGLLALKRPKNRTLSVQPIRLNNAQKLESGVVLLSIGVVVVPVGSESSEARLDIKLTTLGSKVNSLRLVSGMTLLGEAVFALRDGAPEFVGIGTIAVDNGLVAVTIADQFKGYLKILGNKQ